jgi:thiol-disulfide isomerase/thioredoxin
MRKVIIGTLVTVVLVGAALLIERSVRLNRSAPQMGQGEGKVLPADVEFYPFGSKEPVTFAKFKGKAVLVNFWASWCEACMAEMPSIQRLYGELKDKGLEVVAINVDDAPEKVVPTITKRLNLTFPIFTDPSRKLSQIFEVVAIPFSVVADRNQNIVWAESGERDWSSDAVVSEIKKLLQK